MKARQDQGTGTGLKMAAREQETPASRMLPGPGKSTQAPTARTLRPRRRRQTLSGRHAPWWFVVPALAFYLFVIIAPAIRGTAYAFTNWNGLGLLSKFIGIDNFRQILHDPLALAAIRQTLLLTVTMAVGLTVIGLGLALALRSTLKTRNALRAAFFAPAVVAPIMIAFLWQYIMSPFGALNAVMSALGLSKFELFWLGSPTVALWSVTAVIIWQFSGYSMVIFLAGLEAIPDEVNEAALVDGAGLFKRFRYVTLPLLSPALVINVTLAVIMGLKQFETVWIMTQGGPGNSTQTLSTLVYQEAFSLNRPGYATALALVLSVLVMIVSGLLYRISSRRNRLS
jgi:raffinose/stachyose/melibiose transport system permease protein